MQAIFRQYDWLDRGELRRVDGQLVVETFRGTFCIRELRAGERKRLLFARQAQERLRERNFRCFARIVPAKDGRLFIRSGKRDYYVTEWYPDERTHVDGHALGETLARFHRAGRGCPERRSFLALGGSSRPGRGWRKQLREFESLRDRVYQYHWEEPWGRFVLEMFTYLSQLAETAVQYMEAYGEGKGLPVPASGGEGGSLGHASLQRSDLAMVRGRPAVLTNPVSWEPAERTKDIASVGEWLLLADEGGGEHFFTFLRSYERDEPLGKHELAAIYARLLFPGRWFRRLGEWEQGFRRNGQTPAHWEIEKMGKDISRAERRLQEFPWLLAERRGVRIPVVDWLRR
ncbi:spore coat-associated protein CotNH [Bacillaceae bacterium]